MRISSPPRLRGRSALAWLGGASALAICAAAAFVALPVPPALLAPGSGQGVVIADRHGLVLRSTRASDGSDTRWVPYARIDPDVIDAFVAVEDRRFWEHHGIDPRAMLRALRSDLRARRIVSGASTITMQLARLLHPASRSWGGKLAQALWALRLDAHLSKQQIMEQYLNRVELGQGTVGVGAASTSYFGASASDLSVAQAAMLAGLAHAPSRDNPKLSQRRARARRDYALRRMRALGYASRADVERARDEAVAVPPRTPPFLAPHFTSRVLGWLADSAAVGTEVRTSLDLALQGAIEAEVRHTVEVLHDRGVTHAAAVVLDNRSGEVLAWVGSPDFWSADDGQTDMVVSERQPGSALKPFLYGLAFDRGWTAASVLPDIPRTYATATGPYRPRDYDRRFRGPTRAREALASSYNVPAVELASRVGTASLLQTLRLAGFASLRHDAEYYGLGLALGDGDVTLVEMANAYRALANGGEWRPWTWHALPAGAAAGAPTAAGARRVLSPLASAIVLDILADPSARLPGFGASTPFDFPFPVAVKTGTSRHFTDNWAVGTTRGFTVAVWAGNFSGRPMEGVSGVTGAGPLLHRIVMAVAARVPPGALTTPAEAGAVPVAVCRLSGLRATSECAQLTEWFAPGTAPTRVDDWERGGRVVLPDEYAEWAHQGLQSVSDAVTLAGVRPGTAPLASGGWSEGRGPDSTYAADQRASRFRITSPLDGDRYAVPAGVDARYATIGLRASGPGSERVRWSVDGRPWAAERWALTAGVHEVRATSARGETAVIHIEVRTE